MKQGVMKLKMTKHSINNEKSSLFPNAVFLKVQDDKSAWLKKNHYKFNPVSNERGIISL